MSRSSAKEAKQHCKTDDGSGEDVEAEEGYGKREVVRRRDPREPTKEEKEEHEKTHMPFRNWCRHCVNGRGKEETCRKMDRRHEMVEVRLDFMFMGKEESEKTLAMLVVKERSGGMVMSTVAPTKSSR